MEKLIYVTDGEELSVTVEHKREQYLIKLPKPGEQPPPLMEPSPPLLGQPVPIVEHPPLPRLASQKPAQPPPPSPKPPPRPGP
ncbi:hypothetical protein FCV25MIE_10429, partial [Fagus crenata]